MDESTFLEDDWDDDWDEEWEAEEFTYDWSVIAVAAGILFVGSTIMIAVCYLIVMVGT